MQGQRFGVPSKFPEGMNIFPPPNTLNIVFFVVYSVKQMLTDSDPSPFKRELLAMCDHRPAANGRQDMRRQNALAASGVRSRAVRFGHHTPCARL